MNVRQLIALLEKVEDKDRLVYVKSGEKSGGCCGASGDADWDTVTEVEPTMIQEWVWDGKHRVQKSINVIKLDVY